MGKYLYQHWNAAKNQVWSHKCYPSREIMKCTLDVCPTCNTDRPYFPQIDESMIDKFQEKVKNKP